MDMLKNTNNNIQFQNQENEYLNNNNFVGIQGIQGTGDKKIIFNVIKPNIQNVPTSKRTTQEKTEVNNNNRINIKENNLEDSLNREFKNYQANILRNFFSDLREFISNLIKYYNKINQTNYEPLIKDINKNIYIDHAVENIRNLLNKTARDVLDPFASSNYDIKSQSIKNYLNKKEIKEIIIKEKGLLDTIYNDNNMGYIKTVLNKSIKYLFYIYVDNFQPQEEFYIYFPRFQNSKLYLNINGEKEKSKLIEIAKNFEKYLDKKDDDERKGRGNRCKKQKKNVDI